MQVLVLNAGSSTLKVTLLGDENEIQLADELDVTDGTFDEGRLIGILEPLVGQKQVDAVGHRVVHGGSFFDTAVRIDEQVVRRLTDLEPLAPLHQGIALRTMEIVRQLLPQVPAVAAFDTAFHSSLPDRAATYALPKSWRRGLGVRRYGFHGLSHAYASRRVAELVGRPTDELRIVTCHLGSGASLAAVRAGRSVDTTMGFTPLEGLVMASRAGSIDPGLVLWLIQHAGLGIDEVADALEHGSGMVALAGTRDMAAIERRDAEGDPDARLAMDVYVHRLVAAIAAMAAAMGGLDALSFTGGVGERSPTVRARALGDLAFLGIGLDQAHNRAPVLDAEISSAGTTVPILVLRCREDLQIAADVRAVLEDVDER